MSVAQDRNFRLHISFAAVDRTLRILIAYIFLASAIPHFSNPYYFLGSIYAYEIVGPQLGQWISILLPTLEFTIALYFMSGIAIEGAYLLATGAFLFFTIAQSLALWNGLNISCGCFGARAQAKLDALSVVTSVAISSILLLRLFFTARKDDRFQSTK